ncbi:LuxR C-terminal-related transcriptional regulator [Amycolatopsis sp. NPDC054798]
MGEANEFVTILLVEPQTLLREALRDALAGEQDLLVVADTGDHRAGVELSAEFRPDVILIDPGSDPEAIATIATLQKSISRSRLIVLAGGDHPLLRDILSMNPSGYLSKNVTLRELVGTIRMAIAHPEGIVVSAPKISLARIRQETRTSLSDREVQVLREVAAGLSNGQIAAKLHLAEGTVKRHLRNIFTKLGAVSRIDAVNKAVSAAVIAPPNLTALPRRARG